MEDKEAYWERKSEKWRGKPLSPISGKDIPTLKKQRLTSFQHVLKATGLDMTVLFLFCFALNVLNVLGPVYMSLTYILYLFL